MRHKLLTRVMGVAAAFVLSALPSFADETPTKVTAQNRGGDLPFSTSVGTGVERVDLGSGNLIFTIPIASVPGRGLTFSFMLRYDARFLVVTNVVNSQTGATYQLWNISADPYLTSDSTPGVGWTTNKS